MMANRPTEPFCFFCGPKQETSPLREKVPEMNQLKVSKRDKISLKRTPSKLQMTENPLSPPTSPTILSHTTTRPTYAKSRLPITVVHPLTPKPNIRFSWNIDLDQTKKKDLVEEVTPQLIEDQEELCKTKPIYKTLKRLSSLHKLQKASLISIPDSSPKPPKVEQSVIMIDYFHPTSQQRLGLEHFMQEKQK